MFEKREELETKIKEFDAKLGDLEKKIENLGAEIKQKNDTLNELRKIDERNNLKKKNIMERVEDLERVNKEIDDIIEFFKTKLEDIQKKIMTPGDEEVENSEKMVHCEFCDFAAKNQRGMQLHIKAKHDITKVEITVYCLATEKYLNDDRDEYKKELASEIDALEDVLDMNMSTSENVNDYVEKFLPTKVIIRTRIPKEWQCQIFRNKIWERVNSRILRRKILDKKEV